MSTRKSSFIDLVVASVVCAGFLVLRADESAAAVPENASSQQEQIASASFNATSSPVLTVQ